MRGFDLIVPGIHQPPTNITKEELTGLNSLQKRIADVSLVILTTDKSSKFAITDLETYKAMGEEHTKNDRKLGRKEKIEREKRTQ